MRARAETTCTRALAASAFPGRPLLSDYICEAELAAKASMCPVHNSAGHGPNLPKAALTIAQRRQSKTQRANNKAQIRRRALTPSSGSPNMQRRPRGGCHGAVPPGRMGTTKARTVARLPSCVHQATGVGCTVPDWCRMRENGRAPAGGALCGLAIARCAVNADPITTATGIKQCARDGRDD